MAEFAVGTVRVVNANATVRHIWAIGYTGKVGGPFTADEPMTWPGSGAGFFVRDDTAASVLYFYRTAGAEPAVGDTLTGTTSSTTVVVDKLQPGSPPDYDGAGGIAAGNPFSRRGSGVRYNVSTRANDSFVLTGTYAGVTENEAEYSVVKDFTSIFNIPFPNPGEIDPIFQVKEAIVEIDGTLEDLLASEQTIDIASGVSAIDWTVGHAANLLLDENVTTLTFTDPEGPGYLVLRIVQDGTGSRTLDLSAVDTWEGGREHVHLDQPSAQTIYLLFFDGTNYRGWTANGEDFNKELVVSASNAAAFDWNTGKKKRIVMQENSTFSFTDPPGPVDGLILELENDGTQRTITWPSDVNGEPAAAPTANNKTIIRFYWDTVDYWADLVADNVTP